MKFNEIDVDSLKGYLHIDFNDDDIVLKLIIDSVKAYVRGYTSLDDGKLDEYEDISIAVLVLCNELYENKKYTIDYGKENPIVKSILNLHCHNLL